MESKSIAFKKFKKNFFLSGEVYKRSKYSKENHITQIKSAISRYGFSKNTSVSLKPAVSFVELDWVSMIYFTFKLGTEFSIKIIIDNKTKNIDTTEKTYEVKNLQ